MCRYNKNRYFSLSYTYPLLRQGGEADSAVVEGESSVDVLHEAVTEQPDVAAETEVLAGKSTDASAAADLTKVEAEEEEKRSP